MQPTRSDVEDVDGSDTLEGVGAGRRRERSCFPGEARTARDGAGEVAGRPDAAPRARPDVTRELQGAAALMPELRLMVAVLDQAVQDIRMYGYATDEPGRRAFAAVVGWFASDDACALYSFLNVCHALGIDPAAVRARLPTVPQRPRQASRRVFQDRCGHRYQRAFARSERPFSVVRS
jgi:hypothetical protein